jgi:anti-anti-sigma factor
MANNEVQATLREVQPVLVIDLRGAVTTFADAVITGAYRNASTRGARNILLNFAGVDYMNSAGISIIISILTEARKADQQLMVTGLTPHYRKIFEMMGLAQYAPVFDSEEAARQSVGDATPPHR